MFTDVAAAYFTMPAYLPERPKLARYFRLFSSVTVTVLYSQHRLSFSAAAVRAHQNGAGGAVGGARLRHPLHHVRVAAVGARLLVAGQHAAARPQHVGEASSNTLGLAVFTELDRIQLQGYS